MALIKLFQESSFKKTTGALKIYSNFFRNSSDSSSELLGNIQKTRQEDDLPIEMEDPYTTEKPQCILCKYNIKPNFRNVRLLSQFVSSFTGRIYGRHITGLCKHKQEQVEEAIIQAQRAGLMGYYVKNPNFLADPDLYDPNKKFKIF